MTQSASEALKILRDGSLFQWYVITLFALMVYVYAVEVERGNWSLVFAGLAFWGMDWFNEIWNGLAFPFPYRRFDFLRLCGDYFELSRSAYLGLLVVACRSTLVDFSDRLLAFLPG